MFVGGSDWLDVYVAFLFFVPSLPAPGAGVLKQGYCSSLIYCEINWENYCEVIVTKALGAAGELAIRSLIQQAPLASSLA